MLPLTFCKDGDNAKVVRVSGSPETKKHLEDMGFVPEALVKVITIQGGNVIVNVKDARVAIGQSMANKISVETVG